MGKTWRGFLHLPHSLKFEIELSELLRLQEETFKILASVEKIEYSGVRYNSEGKAQYSFVVLSGKGELFPKSLEMQAAKEEGKLL